MFDRRQPFLEGVVGWCAGIGIAPVEELEGQPDQVTRIRRIGDEGPSALCVELIALTAVRPGEARGARWDEIDVAAARWTIPASRMKAGREFVVPLSTGALDVLERARAMSGKSSYVFPSRTGGPLPTKAPGSLLRRAGVVSTPHGFRSSARSWMAETGEPLAAADAAPGRRWTPWKTASIRAVDSAGIGTHGNGQPLR